jgi:hypothetical protein
MLYLSKDGNTLSYLTSRGVSSPAGLIARIPQYRVSPLLENRGPPRFWKFPVYTTLCYNARQANFDSLSGGVP